MPGTNPPKAPKIQYDPLANTTTSLYADQVTIFQKITVTILYYSIAVDTTILVDLGSIAASQLKTTKNTATDIVQLMEYKVTHPYTTMCYQAKDMILWVHSDASYNSKPKSCRCSSGHFL